MIGRPRRLLCNKTTIDSNCNLLRTTRVSKSPFRELWIGQNFAEKVLPNENDIVRKLNSNKTQTFYQIMLRKYEPKSVLNDELPERNLQPVADFLRPYPIHNFTDQYKY